MPQTNGFYQNEKLKIYKDFLRGKTASVIGVGISNVPLLRFLNENGVKVYARDRKEKEKLAENRNLDIEKLQKDGVEFITGENYLENIKEEIVFKSPGVRFDKPEILKAHENGALITSEMEAFLSLCPSKIIVITGSNGKTTTTTLTSEILKNSGHKVWLGGNIGNPLLSFIDEITPSDFTVLELSSFQLHTVNRFENRGLPFAHIVFPDVGVITNISPNHLDWHTDMDEYAFSKRAVFTHMEKSRGKLVINRRSDEYVKKFAKEAKDEKINVATFSAYDGKTDSGASYQDGIIYIDGEKYLSAKDIVIPGLHNIENYMAAILAAKDFAAKEAVENTAKTFAGVPHRLQLISEKNGVKYYNSSIDSSPSRTCAALSCFSDEYNGKINIILGGYDKHIPFDELAKPLCEKNCTLYITGHTAKKIYDAVTESEYYKANPVKIYMCENFDEAVNSAKNNAKSGEIVLLSPACASFDEFANFEKRGERFAFLVNG